MARTRSDGREEVRINFRVSVVSNHDALESLFDGKTSPPIIFAQVVHGCSASSQRFENPVHLLVELADFLCQPIMEVV